MQYRLLIVHMESRLESQVGNHTGIHVRESHGRVLGKNMATASLAPISMALRRFVERADVLCPSSNFYGFGFP